MVTKLEQDRLTAELATIKVMLERRPPGDALGRLSLASRKDDVLRRLQDLAIEHYCGKCVE